MANVELLQNPRWPPNCATYMAPDAPVHGATRLLDHANLNTLWASVSELWPMLSSVESKIAAKLCDLHGCQHT